jgi:hypothetical protein
MVLIKDTDVFIELSVVPRDPILARIMRWICDRYPGLVCITSGYREGDKGVHGTDPRRGEDIRSSMFTAPAMVEADINRHWEYDPARPKKPVARLHRAKKPDGTLGGWHFHIQSHPNTRRRKREV